MMPDSPSLSPALTPELLLSSLNSSVNGITIANAGDPDQPLIYVNQAFERMTGYPAAECLGRNCRFLHRKSRDQPGLEQVRAAIRHGHECRVVLRNFRKDDTPFWNELYISPVRDANGRLTHFIGVQNDITTQVELEESRSQFFQIASHDLRGPLTSIIGTASLFGAQYKTGDPIPADLLYLMRNILVRSQQMQRIIEDYLDFQSLESGQLAVASETFDLVGLAREVLDAGAVDASRKGLSLSGPTCSTPAMAVGDPSKCMQVIQNLLGNAIKFSPPGTAIRLDVIPGSGSCRLQVADEGPGLSDDDLSKVFRKYARLGNRPTGGEKSSGLGLYICRQLIEAMGGEIGVANNPDRGATFWFRLPLAPS